MIWFTGHCIPRSTHRHSFHYRQQHHIKQQHKAANDHKKKYTSEEKKKNHRNVEMSNNEHSR